MSSRTLLARPVSRGEHGKSFWLLTGWISGFREGRWNMVQQIKPGDYLLCYLTGVSRWVGILEVESKPFRDQTPIWNDATFPCRVRVKVVSALTPETAVPIESMRDQLSIFQNLTSPTAWTGHLRAITGQVEDA